MKKLRLDLDELKIESFTTQEADGRGGTVRAYSTEMVTDLCHGTFSCTDGTWGATQGDCSQQCSRNTCAGCTNEN